MVPAMTARDFMVARMVTIHPETHVLEAIGRLLKRRLTGAPVVDDQGHYYGVFSEKCCLRLLTETASQASDDGTGPTPPPAREFMVTRPLTLPAQMDAFEAIGRLLKHHHCGALVVDDDNQYVGVFSQRTSIRVLVHAAYDQLPSRKVAACMESEPGRVTAPDLSLLDVAQVFLENSWRLLPVVEGGRILGQISRCDVLRAEHHLATHIRRHAAEGTNENGPTVEDSNTGLRPVTPALVGCWMDAEAQTISEDTDLFTIAHIFRDTPYRRLPVVRDGRLVGIVTRRHVLEAASQLTRPQLAPHLSSQVFLSAIAEPQDSSIICNS